MRFLLVAAFAATVPTANWMLGNVGTVCPPDGPCLIPVAPGLMAPSGVLMIGLALVLRDAVHQVAGWRWAIVAILIGAALSLIVAPPVLALASTTAFLFSELADFSVYAPLRRRSLGWAVMASGAVGALVDSAVFLGLAFGSLDFLVGQVVGKLWMSAVAALLIVSIPRQSGRGA